MEQTKDWKRESAWAISKPVARADDADRQHAGGMDQFDRSVDRIAADDLCFGVGPFPILDEIERRVFQRLAIPRNDILDSCH